MTAAMKHSFAPMIAVLLLVGAPAAFIKGAADGAASAAPVAAQR